MTAKMREALYPSRAEDDPSHADLLLELLLLPNKLCRLTADKGITKVEERRKLEEEEEEEKKKKKKKKTAQLNRRTDT